jgi:hypothetical protein
MCGITTDIAMPPRTGEIVMGVATAAVATVLYVMRRGAADAWSSSALGHALGVVGLVMMLWAGFGYSARKRRTRGDGPVTSVPMSYAMLLHMVAGLLGPYLVLLHSGLVFRGLAGVLTLVMVLMVASGVAGRALMTVVPRGVVVGDPIRAAMLDADLARHEAALADLDRETGTDVASVAARRDAIKRDLAAARHAHALVQQQFSQPAAAARWRRVLSGWWWLHVPVSAALWILAGAHVVGTMYYALGSR